jgi:poly-gamma-glutamate capsule biosynthesis protein CapA/YwtB (metallophosphatase superfamily)
VAARIQLKKGLNSNCAVLPLVTLSVTWCRLVSRYTPRNLENGPMFRLSLLLVFGGSLAFAQGAGQNVQSRELFTLALTGDAIINQRLSVFKEPEFTRLIDLIRGADASFTNLETLFHDYEMPPAHESGGTWMRTDPPIIKELAWAGFDLVSRANNHAGDFGPEGSALTSKYVREAGLVEAGVGNSLAEAREAKFLETSKARVALISAASTFPPHSRAGNSRGDMPARPGLSPLRFTTTYVLTAERMADLRRVASELSGNPPPAGDTFNFGGRRYVVGTKPGTRTEPNKEDLEAIARVVKSAASLADIVIVSLHCHESGANRSIPADFISIFARAVVDAGADVFVGHGPHVLRGVEIYKGKPILYSLSNFIFQNETLLRMPSDSYEQYALDDDVAQPGDYLDARYDKDRRSFPADREYWDSVAAVTKWRGSEFVELELHPITLGYQASRADRGRPKLAAPADASRILEMMTERSKQFGTTVTISNGIGVVKPQS